MNPKSREFKKLQAIWYKKAAVSGFKDIERNDGTGRLSNDEHTWDETTFKENERYYQLAGQLLHDYPFMSVNEKTVWRLHAEGATVSYIVKRMRVSNHTVLNIINRVSKWIRV